MFKAKNVDITGGPIFKSIVMFAVPVIIGSLIQVLFNAADLMVVGNLSGEQSDIAVGSISATSHITSLLINSLIGLSAGANVLIARTLGQNDKERARTVANTAIMTAIVAGIIMGVVCVAFARTFLISTNCPEDCISQATLYLSICSIGTPFVFIYNFGAAIIRTTGDTQRPLYYLIISGALNLVLNIILCFIMTQKVAAVAIATVTSQFVSAACVLIHLLRLDGPCKLDIKTINFSLSELGNILKIGLPAAVNNALFALSNLQVQAEVNAYGKALMSGGGAVSNLESIAVACCSGFNAAALPFVGQNIGAGNPKRVKQSMATCIFLASSMLLTMSVVIYIFSDFFIGLYLPGQTEAIAYGKEKMLYVLLPYFITSLYSSFVSALQAFGYSFMPMINSVSCVLGLRVIWMTFVYPALMQGLERSIETIKYLYICYPISWILCLIANSTTFFIIYSRYKRGKLRAV